MNKTILTDSCFWLGLVDNNDQHHDKSAAIADLIDPYQIIVPWPILYETVSTYLARRRSQLILLEELITRPNVLLFDDKDYKDEALRQVLNSNRQAGYTYSLTDGVIREILKDINVRLHYFVTFNQRDFIDICVNRQIEIIE
jgi:predicted nucleic acid-binding protein